MVTRAGEKLQCPLGTALNGDHPNAFLHIDFWYMGAGHGPFQHILIIRDDISGYIWLRTSAAVTIEEASQALSTWIAAFGVMIWTFPDQGTHFKNYFIRGLTEQLKLDHRFTAEYSPLFNGTVERVFREVLRSFKYTFYDILRLASRSARLSIYRGIHHDIFE